LSRDHVTSSIAHCIATYYDRHFAIEVFMKGLIYVPVVFK